MSGFPFNKNHEKLHKYINWRLINVEPQEYEGEAYPEMGVILTFQDYDNILHKPKRTVARILIHGGIGEADDAVTFVKEL